MQIANSAIELIGETPLLRIDGFANNLLIKIESFNPYSVKDRIARSMIESAEATGEVDSNTLVVEPTSGNTGIGLATVCAAKDYDLTLTMPDSMSEERRKLLRALGATLELTPAADGMVGAIDRATEIATEHENTFMPQQFENTANVDAHRETTGPELYEATEGQLDAFVAGVGTGGTITGVGEHFREERGTALELIAVEPVNSAVLSGETARSHDIQGIGAGFVSETRTVTKEDAIAAARRLSQEEGITGGISSGANLHVASQVAQERSGLVATIVCDPGERYLSTDLYEYRS
jgi:cysteine synthase A